MLPDRSFLPHRCPLMLREQHRRANVVPNEQPGDSNGGPTLLLREAQGRNRLGIAGR